MLTGIYHLYCTYIEVESDNHLAVAYQKVEQILQKENRDYHMLGRTGSECQSLIQRQTRNTAGLCKWDTVYCAHCGKKKLRWRNFNRGCCKLGKTGSNC